MPGGNVRVVAVTVGPITETAVTGDMTVLVHTRVSHVFVFGLVLLKQPQQDIF